MPYNKERALQDSLRGAWQNIAPGYSAPLRAGCPLVVAIHDVSFAAHQEWFRWREGLRRRWLAKQ